MPASGARKKHGRKHNAVKTDVQPVRPPLLIPAILSMYAVPEDDPAIAKAELDLMDHPIALVGHLPHLNRLAALLTSGDPNRAVIKFLPALMIAFKRQNHQWKIDWTSEEPVV